MNLNEIVKTSGLPEDKQIAVLTSFEEYAKIAEDWKKKADLIIVKDEYDKTAMKEADNARKRIKSIRNEVEKRRKEEKEIYLKGGQLIDSVANQLKSLLIPIEDDLTQKAKYAEIKQKEREDALRIKRNQEVQPYSEFLPYGLDLGVMPEEDYNKLLNGAKLQMEQKIEAERKAEEQRIEAERIAEELRIAREKAEAEALEKVIKENEALKAKQELGRQRRLALKDAYKFVPADEDLSELTNEEFKEIYQMCNAQLEQEQFKLEQQRIERERKEKELQAEREKVRLENEKKERELEIEREKARKIEEEKQALIQKQKDKEEAKRIEAEKIANAPDVEKLEIFVDSLRNLEIPIVENEVASNAVENAKGIIYKIIENINDTIEEIKC